MPHDANTFNVCGEVMPGWQDSFLLKLALQPVGNQLLISSRPVAEDFRAKVFMKSVGDGSATDQRLLENLCD